MNDTLDCRLLTLADVESAASVISQAFVEDLLCRFMLPFSRSRLKTLNKFFRPYSKMNISNQRGYGSGEPLQGIAFWNFPDQKNLSISVKSFTRFLPLLFTMYPIGYLRAKAVLAQIDALYEHFGFQCVEEAAVHGTGLTVWALRRPVQSA